MRPLLPVLALHCALLSTTALTQSAQAQSAQSQAAPNDLGTVTATGAAPLSAPPAHGTAAEVAPSRAPLDAIQPTSIVGDNFIRNSVVPTSNYDDIIKFSPSVANVEPVGAGLQQNFRETIRGFNYTQFNTTFDGLVLPGLPTNFAPQSEAYFMAHDIGSVEVDRGPGTASQIGYATFGGTVSIKSPEPLATAAVNPYATYGSYNTSLFGVRADTGALADQNGARGFLDLEKEDSNGYLSGTATRRGNVFGKFEQPIGDNTLVTLVTMFDRDYNHTPYGATAAQIAQLGPNYALNDNPRSQSNAAYNYDHYDTDYTYLRSKTVFDNGISLENTVYTDGYYQYGTVGLDVNGQTPNLTGRYYVNGVRTTLTNAVPGYRKHNDFRDTGDVLRASKTFEGIGTLNIGGWYNYLTASSYRYQTVLSGDDLTYQTKLSQNPFQYDYNTRLKTFQPYAEIVLMPVPGLQITPGVKYTDTTRDLDALYNRTTKLPAKFSKDYTAIQPSVDVRYTFAPGLVAYAQAAKGFLAPPLNVLYTTAPQNLTPQQTWNYQTGVTYQKDWLTVAADAYYIDFQNLIVTQTVAGIASYFNGGAAVYKGLETEGTVRVGGGASLYGNYSLNDGNYNTGSTPIASVPRTIGAAGLIESRDNIRLDGDTAYASFIGKFVGPQYTNSTITPKSISVFGAIPSYQYADFAFGYTFPVTPVRKLSLRLNVGNVFDTHAFIDSQGTTAAGVPLFYVNPGRSFFVSVSATL